MGAAASTPSAPSVEPPAATCPVDHKTREVWLQQNGKSPHPTSDVPGEQGQPRAKAQRPLSTDREVSNIPRAGDFSSASACPEANKASSSPYAASHGSPSNAESETGRDEATGNWIYPSEKQFFEALMRKGNTPGSTASASELATSKCGGPKLYSFRGLGVDPQYLSPRARINGWLGYQHPFDRHDWVVERCGGEKIEYVIDFYQGKPSGGNETPSGLAANANATPGKLSFFLDVRPKLNTYEGWRLRFNRFTGL
ncbi:Cytochrome c/c1 heme-lyase [Penicillium expansum]|nr:Cytochrome c/c1 heme-lyase [Penicillium expansum]